MTVEADLFNCLKGLVGNRVYPDVAPGGAATPYITYQQVGGESVTFLESVMPDKANGRFQVNVWDINSIGASSLGRQVKKLLIESSTLRADPMGELIATHEPDTKLYGTRQFFSIWFSNT